MQIASGYLFTYLYIYLYKYLFMWLNVFGVKSCQRFKEQKNKDLQECRYFFDRKKYRIWLSKKCQFFTGYRKLVAL